MTDDELNAIEGRAEAATPGPWNIFWLSSFEGTSARIFSDHEDGARDVAHIPKEWQAETDGRFIMHARQDIPALIAEVRRLRAIVEGK